MFDRRYLYELHLPRSPGRAEFPELPGTLNPGHGGIRQEFAVCLLLSQDFQGDSKIYGDDANKNRGEVVFHAIQYLRGSYMGYRYVKKELSIFKIGLEVSTRQQCLTRR